MLASLLCRVGAEAHVAGALLVAILGALHLAALQLVADILYIYKLGAAPVRALRRGRLVGGLGLRGCWKPL